MPVTWIDCPPDDAFALDAADRIATLIREDIDTKGRCVIGLSGGSTPGPVYEALGGEAGIDWSRVTILLIDERCVPQTDSNSNTLMIRSTLLLRADIPESNIVFPDTSLDPAACAEEYGTRLETVLGDGMDIAILGMGPDGHIASLFPPLQDDAFGPATTIHTVTDTFAVHDRVGVTLSALEAAKRRIFLLRGDDKKQTWDDMLASTEDSRRWPAKALLDDVIVFFRPSA